MSVVNYLSSVSTLSKMHVVLLSSLSPSPFFLAIYKIIQVT